MRLGIVIVPFVNILTVYYAKGKIKISCFAVVLIHSSNLDNRFMAISVACWGNAI